MGGTLCREGEKNDPEDMQPFSAGDKDSKVSLEDFDLLKVLYASVSGTLNWPGIRRGLIWKGFPR